jgi:hypothetical protein
MSRTAAGHGCNGFASGHSELLLMGSRAPRKPAALQHINANTHPAGKLDTRAHA